MKIEHINIELIPSQYLTHKELEVRVKADGKEYHWKEIISEDDLLSWFDRIWEHGRIRLKEFLIQEEKSKK